MKDARNQIKTKDKMVAQRYQLISSKNVDDQRTLQSDWDGSTAGNIRPKVAVSDATFLDDYPNARNLIYRFIAFNLKNTIKIL